MLKKSDIEAGLGQTSVVVTQDFVTWGRKFLRCEMVLELGSRMFPKVLCVRSCSYLGAIWQDLVKDRPVGVVLVLLLLL